MRRALSFAFALRLPSLALSPIATAATAFLKAIALDHYALWIRAMLTSMRCKWKAKARQEHRDGSWPLSRLSPLAASPWPKEWLAGTTNRLHMQQGSWSLMSLQSAVSAEDLSSPLLCCTHRSVAIHLLSSACSALLQVAPCTEYRQADVQHITVGVVDAFGGPRRGSSGLALLPVPTTCSQCSVYRLDLLQSRSRRT